MLAGGGHDCVYALVGMVGIVVEKNQFFRPALHHNVDGLPPMAMPPAALAGFIFFRQILSIVDQHVCAFRQFTDVLIEYGMAWLIVRGIDQHLALGFQPEPQATLGMI